MLGRTLQRRLSRRELCIADLPEVDITNRAMVEQAVSDFRPDVLFTRRP